MQNPTSGGSHPPYMEDEMNFTQTRWSSRYRIMLQNKAWARAERASESFIKFERSQLSRSLTFRAENLPYCSILVFLRLIQITFVQSKFFRLKIFSKIFAQRGVDINDKMFNGYHSILINLKIWGFIISKSFIISKCFIISKNRIWI